MPASQGAPATPVCALPGIGLSRAPPGIQGFRRKDRGVTVPSTKSGTPDPRLPAPSSLRSLTLGYCAHHQSPVWRALLPQMQPAPPALVSYPTPNALPGFAGPPWFLFLPPVSRLLFLLLSAPQLLATVFSPILISLSLPRPLPTLSPQALRWCCPPSSG